MCYSIGMKATNSMSPEEYKLRRQYDLAVKRWKKAIRQNGYTLPAFQEMHEAGERLKAFFADRNRDF